MLREVILRLLVGGAFVSAFAALTDILKPKRFAGIFGAAPSVALATVALTIGSEGKQYAAVEARSMIAGAVAFLVYSCCVCWVLIRYKFTALQVTLMILPIWSAVAFGIWAIWLR